MVERSIVAEGRPKLEGVCAVWDGAREVASASASRASAFGGDNTRTDARMHPKLKPYLRYVDLAYLIKKAYRA